MTSATNAGSHCRSGFYYEWTTSRSPLARKLTNYQPFPDGSIASRQLTHGTSLDNDVARSFHHVSTRRRKQLRLKNMDSQTLKAPDRGHIRLEKLTWKARSTSRTNWSKS